MKNRILQQFSVKKQLISFLLFFLIYLSVEEQDFSTIYKGMIALFSSVSAEMIFLYIKKRQVQMTGSSAISGLIVGCVLASSASWWVFSLAAITSICSKHIIRFHNRHVFNPAALGIIFAIMISQSYTQWKGAYHWFIIIPMGLYFTYRFRKILIVFAYFCVFLIFYNVKGFALGESIWDNLLYMNFYFILIMLVEPKTTPSKDVQKVLYGLIVGGCAIGLYIVQIPYDAEIPALLLGNLLYFISNQRRKGGLEK